MNELFNLFEEIGLPYFRQGSMSDEDYQPSFFTFWNIDTPSDAFYDNEETKYHEYIQVGFYTNDAKIIYSKMDEFREAARSKGFVVTRAYDAPSGRDDYYGRVCYIRILHKED